MENISAAGLGNTELPVKILKLYIKPAVQKIWLQVTNRQN
jgi:hypothetical protein